MSGLTLVNPYRPVHFRKLYYKKINLNFYFHNFVWCLKRFYQDTTTKCENENLSHFLSSSRIDTEKVKTLHINFHRTDSPSFSWLYYSPVLYCFQNVNDNSSEIGCYIFVQSYLLKNQKDVHTVNKFRISTKWL